VAAITRTFTPAAPPTLRPAPTSLIRAAAPRPQAPAAGAADTLARLRAIPQSNRRLTFVKPKPKPKSLLAQFGDLVTGLPMGLVGFGKDILTDVNVIPHLAFDAIRGDIGSPNDYLPATGGIITSLKNTGEDILNPSRFVDAYNEGRLIGKIVEDLGNAAIVAGPLAKAIGTGGAVSTMGVAEAARVPGAALVEGTERSLASAAAETTGRQAVVDVGGRMVADYRMPYTGAAKRAAAAGDLARAEQLARVGNKVRAVGTLGAHAGNVPAEVWKLPVRAADWAFERAGRPAISQAVKGAVGEAITKHLPGVAFRRSEEGQVVREAAAQAERQGIEAGRSAVAPAVQFRKSGLSESEGKVAIALIDHPNLGKGWEHLDDTVLGELVNRPEFHGGAELAQRFTAEDIRNAIRYRAGQLPAETMQAMNELQEAQRQVARTRTQRALGPEPAKLMPGEPAVATAPRVLAEGQTAYPPTVPIEQGVAPGRPIVGDTPRGLNPEQLGTDLLSDRVAKYQQGIEAKLAKNERVLGKATAQAGRAARVANANDVVLDATIPPPVYIPPDVGAQLSTLTDELIDATDEYERLAADDTATPEQVAEAGVKVDQLVTQADKLRENIGWKRPHRNVFAPGVDEAGNRNRQYVPTGAPSPYERQRGRQAVLRDRAQTAAARVNRLQKSRANYIDQLANSRNELGRSVQDVLHDDVNVPAVNSLRTAVESGAPKLGGLSGQVTVNAAGILEADTRTLSGTAAHIGKQYNITDELIQRLDDAGGEQLSAMEVGQVITDTLADNNIQIRPEDAVRLTDSIGRDVLLEDMERVFAEEADAGRRLNSPNRVMDVINNNDWNMSQETRNRLNDRWNGYQKRRSKVLADSFSKWLSAQPARFRTQAQFSQRAIGALLEMGEAKNAVHPHSGDVFITLAELEMNTLADMVEAGINPEHLTGGRPAPATSAASTARSATLTQTKQRGERIRRRGFRQLGVEAHARVEAAEAAIYVRNQRNAAIEAGLGKRADDVLAQELEDYAAEHNGEIMPGEALAEAAKELGYAALDKSKRIGPSTMLVSQQVFDTLNPTDYAKVPGLRALTRANQAFKTWVLPFSPKWQIGNVLGNVMQAWAHAGVDPLELARMANRIRKSEGGIMELWRKSGLPDWTREEVVSHGLTMDEYHIMRGGEEVLPRTIVGRTARKSYRLNEFVDNLTRSSVDLAALTRGEGTEAALQTTLRSMGDYTRLTNFERKVVRQVFPFYTWLRHSTIATLRLPITSPTRAAFLLHLSDIYQNDPDFQSDMAGLFGSRIPLFGKLLNVGSAVPFADVSPLGFALDPVNIGPNVSPALKAGAATLFGWDINKMDRISRPPGTSNLNEFGQEKATSIADRIFQDPIHGIGELGYQLTQQGPAPIKAIRDLILGDEVRYGGTGYQVGDLTDRTKRSLNTYLRGLNLPTLDPVPVARS
jgi:hypothetical protein